MTRTASFLLLAAFALPAFPLPVSAQEVPTRQYVNPYGNRYQYGEIDTSQPTRAAYAQRYGVASQNGYGQGTQVELGTGYRQGEMRWNIAGDSSGANPNILSELQWKKLNMAGVHGNLRTVIPTGTLKQTRIEVGGHYEYAVSGDNQDSDYLGDNRTQEFSRSNNDSKGSQALGIKGAVGYELPIVDRPDGLRFIATPLVGWRYEQQKLKIRDGNQTLCVSQPSIGFDCTSSPLGSFAGLDSRYDAKWNGPFIGFESEGATEHHRLRLRGEATRLNYQAEAQWNLRPDLNPDKSFRHTASGVGLNAHADYTYKVTEATGIIASAAWERFTADEDGVDRSYFSNGTTGDTKLNEVEWTSTAYRVGIDHKF